MRIRNQLGSQQCVVVHYGNAWSCNVFPIYISGNLGLNTPLSFPLFRFLAAKSESISLSSVWESKPILFCFLYQKITRIISKSPPIFPKNIYENFIPDVYYHLHFYMLVPSPCRSGGGNARFHQIQHYFVLIMFELSKSLKVLLGYLGVFRMLSPIRDGLA